MFITLSCCKKVNLMLKTFFRKLAAIEGEDPNLKLVSDLIRHIHTSTKFKSGSILVFLSGWEEQQRLFKIMVQLHSS